jgi:hypothetical protein
VPVRYVGGMIVAAATRTHKKPRRASRIGEIDELRRDGPPVQGAPVGLSLLLAAAGPSRWTVLVPSYHTMVRPVGPSPLTGLQQTHPAWLSNWNCLCERACLWSRWALSDSRCRPP